MRSRALVFLTVLLAGSVGAQPTATPPTVAPLKVNPAAAADMVVRAVAARALPPRVPVTSRVGLDEVIRLLRASKTTEAREQWVRVVPATGLRSQMDVEALIQWVLRQSYLETSADLKAYADKVRYYNELKQTIREELAKARQGRPVRAIAFEPYRLDGAAIKSAPPRVMTKVEQDQYVKALEDKLASIGDDAQLANVDLQNMLQKQQQTLQTMSNVSKMLHDTAMAVIRKIGG